MREQNEDPGDVGNFLDPVLCCEIRRQRLQQDLLETASQVFIDFGDKVHVDQRPLSRFGYIFFVGIPDVHRDPDESTAHPLCVGKRAVAFAEAQQFATGDEPRGNRERVSKLADDGVVGRLGQVVQLAVCPEVAHVLEHGGVHVAQVQVEPRDEVEDAPSDVPVAVAERVVSPADGAYPGAQPGEHQAGEDDDDHRDDEQQHCAPLEEECQRRNQGRLEWALGPYQGQKERDRVEDKGD